MATFTDALGLIKQAVGENPTVWMDVLNGSLLDLIDQALAQSVNIDVTAGNVTLVKADGATDQARAARLNITGSPGASRDVIVPSEQKVYIVVNGSGSAVTVKTQSGVGDTLLAGETRLMFVDDVLDDVFLAQDVFQSTVEQGAASQDVVASTVSNATGGTSTPTVRVLREGVMAALTIASFSVTVNSTSFVVTPDAGSYPEGVDPQDVPVAINENGTVHNCFMRVSAAGIEFFKASGDAWTATSSRFVPSTTAIISEAEPESA